MKTQGSEFATVLKEAQELGYAERNPEADVEGYDACRKIAILTSLAYGMHVDFEQIYTEGITKITAEDIKYANVLEASIKLLATSKNVDGKVYAMVAPKLITDKHPLFSVNDVFNGILVKGNLLGDVMFYGSGAGKLPTASAVVSDVVDATKHMGTNIMTLWSSKHLIPADMNSYESKFFVRVPFAEEETAKELFQIAKVVTAPDVEGEYAFITEKMTEEAFEEAAKKISIVNRIRVEF